MEAIERRDPLRFWAILLTVVLHAGVLGGAFIMRMFSFHHTTISTENYVDAQLVRFGKPRDLSFLPHKEGHVKDKPPEIKVAKDMNALPHIEDKKEPKDVDPLKKTHAEQFKNLQDPNEGVEPSNVGSLTGSRAGTATEAKGDPYILQLVDQIGSAWTVPTTLTDAQLAKLTAGACLTISETGTLTSYKITEPSGNSQFDSSLDAALSTIKKLPPPPDRDIQTPNGPKNLKYLATRGKLCAGFSPPAK
ncbi:MAG TPA: TonB C-terminal domain-containing protein [Polyangia bacterium]